MRWADRSAVLAWLPRDAVCAELGVLRGNFSSRILRIAQPRRLHLIDAWESFPQRDWPNALNTANKVHYETLYQSVLNRFAAFIARATVCMHRASTAEAASGFTEYYFDWVYVDANHTYKYALADLEDYAPLVKPGGYLWGHDYTLDPQRDAARVYEAVEDFRSRHPEMDWLGVTEDFPPSFVMRKTA